MPVAFLLAMDGRAVGLLAMVAACGGTTTTTTTTSSAIVGSYDVSFSAVNVSHLGTLWGGVGSPALTTAHARLDIVQDADGYGATLTPEWDEPQGFTVNVTNEAITLSGNATFTASNTNATISDRITSMRLLRKGGGLAGSGSVVGTENVFEGDVGDTSDLTANVIVAKDTTAPRVRDESHNTAGTAHLPWDPIIIQTSEPIDMEKVRAATSLGSILLSDGLDRAHSTSITLYAASWDAFGAPLRVAGGAADPSGNASVAFEGAWNVLDVGKPAASSTLQTGRWGSSANVTAACESGSCLELGPAKSWCDAIGSGIGTRIVTKGYHRIAVRYRLRAQNQFSGPGQLGLRVGVARPGEAASSMSFTPQIAPTNDTDFPYASAWDTAKVDLSRTSDEAGVAVSIGSAPGFCGGPSPEPTPFVADIQSITAE